MNASELKKIVAAGETESVEFKETLSPGFYHTISAFANRSGGTIFLGVDNKGNIVGVDSSNQFLEDLTNRLVNKLSLYPEIETLDFDGKRVLIVKITRAGYPVSFEGRYYERVGNTTREMSPQWLLAFTRSSQPWDAITGDFSIEEIDVDTVNLFVRLAVKKDRLTSLSVDEPLPIIFEKLELIKDGKLTHAAILLFSKKPQKHFINHCVRIGRLKTDTIIIDDKWAKGNLFQQFEETLNILKQFISVRYEITDFQREDIWDYPIPALREAVLNALMHRDYYDIANFIQIKVYDDHIWFFNQGKLMEGLTIDQLKKPHSSYLRNPLIAKIFYLAGFIEQYGSGTVRMVEWMREAELPEPEYREEMGGFSAYFYKDIYREDKLQKLGLNERQIKAVMYVKEKGKITNKEYQELLNISKRTATNDLENLVQKNLFKKFGTRGKGTVYSLIKKAIIGQIGQ